MTPVRPDLALLWPSYTLFPLAGLAILVFGASGSDGVMVAIGLLLLAANAAIVVNYAYFTKLGIEEGDLVYRTNCSASTRSATPVRIRECRHPFSLPEVVTPR